MKSLPVSPALARCLPLNTGASRLTFARAKALTSGYFPIGGVMAGGKVSQAFTEAGATFAHLVTFGGNPPAAAAAHANLDIMVEEDFVERSATMGTYLYEQLKSLLDLPIVGQVRGGLGLLAAIELVQDRSTKTLSQVREARQSCG